MSRSGYRDDYDGEGISPEFWGAIVRRAAKGKRGQQFFRDLRDAMDAMPVKRLISGELVAADGEVCAIGSVAVRRQVDVSSMIKPADCDQDAWDSDWECEAQERAEALGALLNIAPCLAQDVMYHNDECDQLHHDVTGEIVTMWRGERPPCHYDTPEERWVRMRKWVAKKLGEVWPPPESPVNQSGNP